MSSGSPSPTSGSPHASFWAAPPEFYLDENNVTRRVRKLLVELGYRVHTPAELYGSRDEALGAKDEDWLLLVGQRGWIVLATDIRIFEREHEYQAYLKAGTLVFLLPGESKVDERVDLVRRNLAEICSYANQRGAGVWRLTANGTEQYQPPAARNKNRPRIKRLGRG